MSLDTEADAYVLNDVIQLIGTYTFSIWHKSEKENTISFNILGVTDEISSTTQWQKYSKTIEVSALDVPNIYMSPSLNIETYFYEGFLSEGTLDSSWTPAPEDYSRNFIDIRSEIKQTADSIISKVEANDGRLSSLAIGLNGVLANVETLDGNVGKLEVSSNEIKAEILDARGNSSSLKVKLDKIESSVVDVENNVQSKIEQAADSIRLSISGSARNLIKHSKNLFHSNYVLLSGGIIKVEIIDGILKTSTSATINENGILTYTRLPSLNEDGVLKFN